MAKSRYRPWLLATSFLLFVSAAGAQEEPGDPLRGEALYVGTASFAEGAAPCLGCHGVAGAGLGKAAGASYGPDLTQMWENFGAEGVEEVLATLPFPSMTALYDERPLTAAERLDMAAFLREVSGREAPRVAGSLLVEAGAAVGVFFIVLGAFGGHRLRPIRSTGEKQPCRDKEACHELD